MLSNINCYPEINNDMDKVSRWLKANKLSLNFETTVQVNITNK